MTLRAARRAVALGLVLTLCVLHYWWFVLRGRTSLADRALWLQAASRRILAALGIRYTAEGRPPAHGLLVANHLSYLDILILSAATPCFFVAKAEIDRWPYFGRAARTGGTIFIDRSSLASAERVAAIIAERLSLPVPVLFFPEGTSTDGATLLRFHSRLFEPAIVAGALVTTAALRYVPFDGIEERELCWFGDEEFLPHLWRTLGSAGFTAEIVFGEPRIYGHRREAADQTREEILAVRNGALVLQ